MTIVIKDIFSLGLLDDKMNMIEICHLPDQENIELGIRVIISFSDSDSENVFDSIIVTGRNRLKYQTEDGKNIYKGRIFSYEIFKARYILDDIKKRIMNCDTESREKTLKLLNNIMFWEFDGME